VESGGMIRETPNPAVTCPAHTRVSHGEYDRRLTQDFGTTYIHDRLIRLAAGDKLLRFLGSEKGYHS
jgi:hypothetical protein